MDEKIKNIFDRLSKSKFRSSFHLKDKDILYIENKGIDKILKKVGEECTEVIIAAKGNDKDEIISEICVLLLKDLLILLMLLMVNKRQ